MYIEIYDNPESIEYKQKQKILSFISQHIAEGSVIMQSNVYEKASLWIVLKSYQEEILGISAQKLFKRNNYNLIQIMATFLDKKVRGRKFAVLLLQGFSVVKLWKESPFKKIYWCTRTRILGVYRIACHYNEVYPKIDSISKNRKKYRFALEMAKHVYGSHISLNPDTYIMYDSYPDNSIFLYPATTKNSKYNNILKPIFNVNFNFLENQAIFIFSKIRTYAIGKFIVCIVIFKTNNYFKKLISIFAKKYLNTER